MADETPNLNLPFARLSALAAHHHANETHPNQAGIELYAQNAVAMIELSGDIHNYDFLSAARAALACALPITPGYTSVSPHCIVLWMAPNTWLITSTNGRIKETLEIPHSYATDVSHTRTLIRISGRNTRDLLSKGCALDLHPTVFKVGTCVRTALAHTPVILHLRDHAGGFDLYVPRSYAVHMWDWLNHAAAEFGVYIAPLS